MSSSTEDLVRDLFAADAAAAPDPADLSDRVLRRVCRRRWAQGACAVGAAVAVTVGGVLVAGAGQAHPRPMVALPAVTRGASAPPASQSAVLVPPPASALPGRVADSCAVAYSPAAVAHSGFAFDGTVVGIGPARSNRPGVELPLAGVTFSVHQWFRGGRETVVVVDLGKAGAQHQDSESTFPPYALGTRLLVAGAPRWGGRPLDSAIAWSCGFTRPFDPTTAAAWAAATR